MASPAANELPNGISSPTATGAAANLSPPTASSTQPNTQSQSQSQPQSQSQSQPQPQQASQPSQQPTSGADTAPAAQAAQPAFAATSLQDTGSSKRPRDARLIHLVLANMGVRAYSERVPLQLLDFAYRYTSGILSDAIAYEPPAQVTSKRAAARDDEGVSLNAIRTAVGARASHQFSGALPKEFMMEVAAERNKIALPRIEREFGVRLPPERYCFTGVGWGVRESWEEEVEEEGEGGGVAGTLGLGGPVGGGAAGGAIGGDAVMGGMEEEDVDEDQFEEVMGVKDTTMADG